MMTNERKDIRTQIQQVYKFQTLIHKVNKEALYKQHEKQSEGKAAGVDGITKGTYDPRNIDNLVICMKNFSYKPKSVRRTYISKANRFMIICIVCLLWNKWQLFRFA